jgi:hypothetical protein
MDKKAEIGGHVIQKKKVEKLLNIFIEIRKEEASCSIWRRLEGCIRVDVKMLGMLSAYNGLFIREY